MTFYEKYEALCAERGMKPQSPEMFDITGVSAGAISGWKKGALPKAEVLTRLSQYFDVTTDYLLGLSTVRKPQTCNLTEEERLLLEAYRSASTQGRFHIIQVCMNEKTDAPKGEVVAG